VKEAEEAEGGVGVRVKCVEKFEMEIMMSITFGG
jgi:hypothetical protein